MAERATPMLEVRDLNVYYGQSHALRDALVTFSIVRRSIDVARIGNIEHDIGAGRMAGDLHRHGVCRPDVGPVGRRSGKLREEQNSDQAGGKVAHWERSDE